MKQIIFASKNKGKIREVTGILGDLNIQLLSLMDFDNLPDITESGKTFEENAKIKAEETYNKFKIPSIADDSGLEVEQLNDAPGIFSARFAGQNATDEENNQKLIVELKKTPEPHKAKFICTAVFYDGKKFITSAGELIGKIIHKPRGTNGFGYDPYFVPNGFKCTMAELTLEEKNKISHRYKAFNNLKKLIKHNSEIQ